MHFKNYFIWKSGLQERVGTRKKVYLLDTRELWSIWIPKISNMYPIYGLYLMKPANSTA